MAEPPALSSLQALCREVSGKGGFPGFRTNLLHSGSCVFWLLSSLLSLRDIGSVRNGDVSAQIVH